VVPSRVRDQLNQAPASAPAAPARAAAPAQQTVTKPAAPVKPATSATNPTPSQQTAKKAAAPGTKISPAPAAKTTPNAAKGTVADKRPVETPEQKPAAINRRDPFDSLLTASKPSTGPPENLPPGKAGLMVSTLQIDGIVRGKGGMIVIVSNPQKRVYFLREGDKLYDGSVEHVTLDEVAFHEVAKDAFGKPIERQVTKRLYPTSPGEQR
jgi:hypothetical protein